MLKSPISFISNQRVGDFLFLKIPKGTVALCRAQLKG